VSDTRKKNCVYTIPAGLSFVDILARGILDKADGDPLALARMQILLPTRRACRSLREAFLRLSGGKPLLLPRMNPIGDVDEEELSIALSGMEDELSIPPAIPTMRRLFLLAKLIGARQDYTRGLEQDLLLATALGKLMDQVYTEDLSLSSLPALVEESEFSAHWQVSIKFLTILSETWPQILQEMGVIDAADRRNRLIKRLADHWAKNPPAHPVFAAGSTGSIPATSKLLETIAAMPQGCIILPGLDQGMDEESWAAMDDTHPQATLRHLLNELKERREDVALWPVAGQFTTRDKIRALSSEVMRPADTAQEWQTIGQRLSITESDIGIRRYDCASPQEEALVIALALRETLEEDGKTAALVTPDRLLARRVAMACRRWGIEIDDSGGQALTETRVGTYLRLCMEAVCAGMKPIALLNFAKHALCLPEKYDDWRGAVRALDLSVFRGPAFQGGLEAYEKKFAALEERERPTKHLRHTLSFIARAFKPLLDLAAHGQPLPFSDWCEAHLKVAESFCQPDILWAGQDGDAAAKFFSSLREQSDLLPAVTGADYLALFQRTMAGISVRPAFGLHPRLMILGQLEARLVEADVMILSGLNENTWPPDPGVDPWMSRPMRKRFKLPPLERSIGLSAHDFAQSLCAERVILTRSLRVDGTPTVPARWLQRMDTVLRALGIDPDILQSGPLLAHARKLDHSGEYQPWERPEPRPPVSARPRKLSVTQIETWMTDPYSVYARHVLRLRALDPIEQPLDAAMRGTLVHETLDRFVEKYPDRLPPEAYATFLTIAKQELDTLGLERHIANFWQPRLSKIASWLIDTETGWRATYKPAAREATGEVSFKGPAGDFLLTARVDRIDETRDGREAAIIDYKTGGTFSLSGMKDGRHPQLPLEALILEDGGFEGVKKLDVSALAYWVVNGSGAGGDVKILQKPTDLSIAKDNARAGLENLIATFDHEDAPYYSLPRPERAPRFNDYEHLARVKEWTALDDSEEAA
jgi:ATP-dependent helicase/nuclease subunit B